MSLIKVICLLENDKYAKYMETYLADKTVAFGTELWMVQGFPEDLSLGRRADLSGGRRAYNMGDFISISEMRDKKINDILND